MVALYASWPYALLAGAGFGVGRAVMPLAPAGVGRRRGTGLPLRPARASGAHHRPVHPACRSRGARRRGSRRLTGHHLGLTMAHALRRGGHRVRVRRQRGRAAAGREGLPGRRSWRPAGGSPTTSSRRPPGGCAGSCGRRRWAASASSGIDLLRGRRGAGVLVLSGAGVGGGTLVYANTLYRPPDDFYDDPQWRDITDWRAELAPLLRPGEPDARGRPPTRRPPRPTRRCGRSPSGWASADTFRPTPVGVFFGEPGRDRPDPYFGGAGPDRTGCLHCGECMTGCRHGAKNTLVKNYLYLAERAGAGSQPLTTVTAVRPAAGRRLPGRRPAHRRPVPRRRRRSSTPTRWSSPPARWAPSGCCTRCAPTGPLPHLSARLGALTRTNSESILGARCRRGARGAGSTSHRRRGDHQLVPPGPATPTSSRSATARAPTRWACCSRC